MFFRGKRSPQGSLVSFDEWVDEGAGQGSGDYSVTFGKWAEAGKNNKIVNNYELYS